jgi:ribosomal protein S27AE
MIQHEEYLNPLYINALPLLWGSDTDKIKRLRLSMSGTLRTKKEHAVSVKCPKCGNSFKAKKSNRLKTCRKCQYIFNVSGV